MSLPQIVANEGSRPIKIWTPYVEESAMEQLEALATLPFIHKHGIAVMPDVHAGKGSTIGSVIATNSAIVPSCVGVDIGCGMVAVRTSLLASDLPDSLLNLRHQIERDIPMGAGGSHSTKQADVLFDRCPEPNGAVWATLIELFGLGEKAQLKFSSQLGTLGSGNHFIELCLDENQNVWVMLHSGSRGIGNMIGQHFISKAKRDMERYFIHLPDVDLAYLPQDTQSFNDYVAAVGWAQDYAAENRTVMMEVVLEAMRRHITKDFYLMNEIINCHHNYIERENHFGENLWITRKGAIRARKGDLGIIPGSMGQKSFIVRGKGNPDSYMSCSHGAGRKMSRAAARRTFTVQDLVDQTAGVECRKDSEVLDEIPGAYKSIDEVMANQADLVSVVHSLKQVMCVKGG